MSGTTVITSESLARERDFDDSCKAALQLRHALAMGMIT
jgi:hypothetical protein